VPGGTWRSGRQLAAMQFVTSGRVFERTGVTRSTDDLISFRSALARAAAKELVLSHAPIWHFYRTNGILAPTMNGTAMLSSANSSDGQLIEIFCLN